MIGCPVDILPFQKRSFSIMPAVTPLPESGDRIRMLSSTLKRKWGLIWLCRARKLRIFCSGQASILLVSQPVYIITWRIQIVHLPYHASISFLHQGFRFHSFYPSRSLSPCAASLRIWSKAALQLQSLPVKDYFRRTPCIIRQKQDCITTKKMYQRNMFFSDLETRNLAAP